MFQDKSRSANHLLSSLPEAEYQRLEPYLTSVNVSVRTVFYEAAEQIKTVYFPQTALISLVSTLKNGATCEIGLIGSTGMVGLPVCLGSGYSQNRAIVQVPGGAIKISAQILKQEFDRDGELQKLLLRYTETRLNEIAQLAVCNAHHKIEQRLARWLLMVQDLIQSDEIPLTQEFLGDMLGVQRSGVTLAAGILQQAGLISYSRGKIKIKSRPDLEKVACECYQLFYENFRRQSA